MSTKIQSFKTAIFLILNYSNSIWIKCQVGYTLQQKQYSFLSISNHRYSSNQLVHTTVQLYTIHHRLKVILSPPQLPMYHPSPYGKSMTTNRYSTVNLKKNKQTRFYVCKNKISFSLTISTTFRSHYNLYEDSAWLLLHSSKLLSQHLSISLRCDANP